MAMRFFRFVLPLPALLAGILAPAAWCAAAGGPAAYVLQSAAVDPAPAGAPPVIFAATFEPAALRRETWDDRLFKLQRGGFNALHLVVPPDAGSAGALGAADVAGILNRTSAAGMKVVIGAPAAAPAAGWGGWVSVVRAAAEKEPGAALWVQVSGGAGGAALTDAARVGGLSLPVVAASARAVESGGDTQRPYRQPDVAVALRRALSEGATAVAWGPPFAGMAPPLAGGAPDAAPDPAGPEAGALPISYYEGRLFGQVVRCLGPALAGARPVAGASAAVPGIRVAQRNAGGRGFLFVETSGELAGRYHLSFTEPGSGRKLTVPAQEGLALRSFGAGARILPLNLPVPGATIRYSTAEVFGVYRVGKRTAILVTDDRGAPNEIALALPTDAQPAVLDSPAPPVWDAKTRTLTLGFVPSFDDLFIPIGDDLLLGIIPTERAQRTWSVRRQEMEVPVITSAYLVSDGRFEAGKWVVDAWTRQGKAAVVMLPGDRPRYLAVNRVGPRVGYSGLMGAFLFFLESGSLAEMKLPIPPVQVLKEARFAAGEDGADFARPDYDAGEWEKVSLAKPRGAGRYRIPFKLPAMEGWTVPWRTTLHLAGTATLFLNGQPLGKVAGGGEKDDFVEVLLPAPCLRPAGEENLLALSVAGEGRLAKVGIAPWAEHAVQRHEMVFTLE
ncbi:MAG: hypothetical protein HY321_18880 [Armatimonadetes bacterium]|nr:hypothetical protein [Armatimonadota bacterium]